MDWPEDIKETTSDGDEEVYWSGINRILLEDEVREPETRSTNRRWWLAQGQGGRDSNHPHEAATSALPSKH